MTVRCVRALLLLSLIYGAAAQQARCEKPQPGSGRYVAAVRHFADTVLQHGRDVYGKDETPLFVDGLQVETLTPVLWKHRGETWVLSNFASQQALLRTLDGLTGLTGEEKYRRAAEEATRYALEHLRTPNGLLYWGGHLAWDLQEEKPVGQYANIHEMKMHEPYYAIMDRVSPEPALRLMETVWAGHILDWPSLDYNRHANADKPCKPRWDAKFDEDLEVPFPASGSNLSFVNVTPPLMHAGVMLAILDGNRDALTWTRRLVHRWREGRDPKTGLCGGQLSYREHDRAQDALGHVHPGINEAKIVASYHQTGRYHHLPLAQMQAGEALIGAGGELAETGREFIRWASDDLKVYARCCYDSDKGWFTAVMTNGEPIRWREAREGYYVAESFAPRRPDGDIFWSYAMAYRLTRDADHWDMVRRLAEPLQLGDVGSPDGRGRALRADVGQQDWRIIYALIELNRATKDRAMLELACRVADNVLAMQTKTGLFPRAGRVYARTGDFAPLAVLHLAAALDGKEASLPQAVLDSHFFHCEYDGPLAENQKKRADKRTYDWLVFYGR